MKVIDSIFGIRKLLVVGVYGNIVSGDVNYSVLLAAKSGNNLVIKEKFSCQTLEEIVQKYGVKIPVIVLYDGKGVICRKVNHKDPNDIRWKQNLDLKVTYYTSFVSGTEEFTGICRDKIFEPIYNELVTVGFDVADCYIGPLTGVLLSILINKKKYCSNNTLLITEDKKIVDVARFDVNEPTEDYIINDATLTRFELPLYGAAINFFAPSEDIYKKNPSSVNREEIVYKKAFNITGAAILVTVFISLIVSYLLIQFYISANSELNSSNLYSAQTLDFIKELEQQRDKKLKILRDTGQTSKDFITFYAYSIIKSVPGGLTLNSVDVFPISEDVKDDKKINIDTRHISITGNAVNDLTLNQWIREIRELRQVKDLEIIFLKKDKNNIQTFEITITLNDI